METKLETLMDQASMTAHTYLHRGIKSIDDAFGPGYSKTHPELLGAFIQTCAKDFDTAVISITMRDVLQEAGGNIADIADALKELVQVLQPIQPEKEEVRLGANLKHLKL